ncbi:MAG: purine-nucleoside phosphorylase [bacterium]|nr:purine-nucleoside phosphorylase [bacterium]
MTPHIEAKNGEIAKNVIMSGDPLRAEFIAKNYLDNYKLVNKVRGMYAFTGYYKGKEVTVMGHGMGQAGAGIYFYELFKFYDVDNIIRIGTCGTTKKEIQLLDTILVTSSYTESNYAFIFSKENVYIENASTDLISKLELSAKNKNININKGTVMTCDAFDPYIDWKAIYNRIPKNLNILATEMESFALFHIARILNKNAGCLLTVVDSKCTTNNISSEDREKSLTDMIEIALDSILL